MDEEDPGKPGGRIKECDVKTASKMSEIVPVKPNISILQENGVLKTSVVENEKTTDILGSEDEVPYPKKVKLDSDTNPSDAAETIKKIQAFIALGKIDESKKELEIIEKPIIQKSPAKKVLESRENQEETGDEKINNINELQRTLQGLDDSQDNTEIAEVSNKSVTSTKGEKKEVLPSPLKENNRDPRSSEGIIKFNELLTPSRVSKRIQSKTVKFSARKMLRGDDSTVLKRMIPGYEKEMKQKKGIIKVDKSEPKKYNPLKASSLSEEDVSLESDPRKEAASDVDLTDSEKTVASKKVNNTSPSVSNVSPKTNSNVQPPSPSSPISPKTSASLTESRENSLTLADKLGKFAVTNGKITLELKTAQQRKKVVRIAVPPQTTSSSYPKASLGPDIIIKRVKPVKKSSEVSKEPLKEVDQTSPALNMGQIVKMSPRVSIEKIPVKKLKDDIVRIQKNIIKSGKPEESKVMSIKYVHLPKPAEDETTDSVDPSTQVDKTGEDAPSAQGSLSEKPSMAQQLNEVLDNTANQYKSGLSTLGEDSLVKKPRGRRPKSKVEPFQKKHGKVKNDRSPSVSDVEEPPEEMEPEDFPTLFDRYFSTSERYVEHHDSLDSDSSDEFDNKIYSHFINLKNKNTERKKEKASVYDIMNDISIELPTWNIHASSNGDLFYLVQVDSQNDRPLMKKVVELDLNHNAKVYMDDKLLPEYEGNYSSYEDIRQLIYDIDQM